MAPDKIFKKRKECLKYIIDREELLQYIEQSLELTYETIQKAIESYAVSDEERRAFHKANSFKDIAEIILNREYWWEKRF